jgi:hypothetical protein
MVKNRHKVLVAIIGARTAFTRQSYKRLYALFIARRLNCRRDETPGKQTSVLFWTYGVRDGMGLLGVRGKNY